jgi:hypothetical protein
MPRTVRGGLNQATLSEPATAPIEKIKQSMIEKHVDLLAQAAPLQVGGLLHLVTPLLGLLLAVPSVVLFGRHHGDVPRLAPGETVGYLSPMTTAQLLKLPVGQKVIWNSGDSGERIRGTVIEREGTCPVIKRSSGWVHISNPEYDDDIEHFARELVLVKPAD